MNGEKIYGPEFYAFCFEIKVYVLVINGIGIHTYFMRNCLTYFLAAGQYIYELPLQCMYDFHLL